MKLIPLKFKPKLLSKIWGGARMAAYGKPAPQGSKLGESWEIYDRPGDSAVVAEGPFAGQTLAQLMAEFGPGLLGAGIDARGYAHFPLMLKLVDAQEALSVQVHPNDDEALAMVGPGELGKNEMWLVLEAEAGATLAAGLKPGVDAARFRAALKDGSVENLLNVFPVQPGDLIDVPAGRLHALGKGCLVAELQQNSDTTYRVWDYLRLEDGKPRPLHLDQALRCARFGGPIAAMPDKVAPKPEGPGLELLLDGPNFQARRLKLQGRFRPGLSQSSFQILLGLKGQARLSGAWGEMRLARGESVLVPADCAWELGGDEAAELLWATPK